MACRAPWTSHPILSLWTTCQLLHQLFPTHFPQASTQMQPSQWGFPRLPNPKLHFHPKQTPAPFPGVYPSICLSISTEAGIFTNQIYYNSFGAEHTVATQIFIELMNTNTSLNENSPNFQKSNKYIRTLWPSQMCSKYTLDASVNKSFWDVPFFHNKISVLLTVVTGKASVFFIVAGWLTEKIISRTRTLT